MAFVDTASVTVVAGNGGDGMVNFRREPYVSHGGPDGGDGGNGGSVVFIAEQNVNTLVNFRFNKRLQAKHGGKGAKQKKHGRDGEDLIIKVPVGTMVAVGDHLMCDLIEAGQSHVVAKGGKGGFGNAHFTSSRRQAPKIAEKGEIGEEFELTLELKMIADVGLVGLPNAGKSTLLSVISNARPRIANYPFTTLEPNLGVADIDEDSLLVADIPGLIEGASEGKGLGDDFLRHVERTAVLIHLVDAYSEDIAKDYTVIKNELKRYQIDLSERPSVIALSKIDGLDDEIIADQVAKLEKVADGTEIIPISSMSKQGLKPLLRSALKAVDSYREVEVVTEVDEMPVYRIETKEPWTIEEVDGVFIVTGEKIEGFARRTDFDNEEGVDRLHDIMFKMGIENQLQKLGAKDGSTVLFGSSGRYKIKL